MPPKYDERGLPICKLCKQGYFLIIRASGLCCSCDKKLKITPKKADK